LPHRCALPCAAEPQCSSHNPQHTPHMRPTNANNTHPYASKPGHEIWDQTGGRVDAFVSGAGTGGTIAGVSEYLKSRDPAVKVFLIDPPGSSLYNKVGFTAALVAYNLLFCLLGCSPSFNKCCTLGHLPHPHPHPHQVTRGVLYTKEEAEGTRLKHPFDTITEGIGLNRLTANFSRAAIDGAFKGTDREAVEMAAHLLR
jgi:cysteine synthase A